MIILNFIALALVIVGALNWGLVGIFNWNLVEAIFGGYNVGSIIVYILVCLAGIWLIVSLFINRGKIKACNYDMLSKMKNDEMSKNSSITKNSNKTDE